MSKAKKILVVEDEKPMARALQLKLQGAGFEVRVTCDGQECVAALEKEDFDLMLLDLVMPRLDGFGVLAWLKEKGTPMKVFVLTNLSQKEDEERTRALGAKEFIVKTDTSLAQVVERVQKILGLQS